MLKQVAEHLVDVHGQHDHQYLLKPSNQLDVLDQFGDLWPLRRAVPRRLRAASSTPSSGSPSCRPAARCREQQLELYRFQADEIDTAELDPGEYAELRVARRRCCENLEKLKKDAGAVHGALYEADGSVLERLKMMAAVLAELSGARRRTSSPIADSMRDATIALEEVAFDLSRYLDKLDLDPGELAEVDDRLNTINRILNKYGDPLDDDARLPRGDRRRRSRSWNARPTTSASLQKRDRPAAASEIEAARRRSCRAKRQAVGEEARRR